MAEASPASVAGSTTPTVIGVSLKMYLDLAQTAEWSVAVAAIASGHPAITSGATRLFVLPSLPSLGATLAIFEGTRVEVGAQDLFWEDRGAYTGGVSGADLAAMGCRLVEVNHAERHSAFGEDDATAARKLAAAFRNGLTPVLCVGEADAGPADVAAAFCVERVAALLSAAPNDRGVPLVVAYEPVWAIGADTAASADHVRLVTAALRAWLDDHVGADRASVIYGGSAGPGVFAAIDDAADGLFLGRFAHDPAALAIVLDETLQRSASTSIPPTPALAGSGPRSK